MEQPEFYPNQAVRFTGGKYNGFQGTIRWLGDTSACVIVQQEGGKSYELIEDLVFLKDLKLWQADRSKTELALRSNA